MTQTTKQRVEQAMRGFPETFGLQGFTQTFRIAPLDSTGHSDPTGGPWLQTQVRAESGEWEDFGGQLAAWLLQRVTLTPLQQAAASALQAQNACNLSGLAHSLAEAMVLLWDTVDSTQEANTHPIVTLYLLKMAELNGCGSTLHEAYGPAEQECKRIAEGR